MIIDDRILIGWFVLAALPTLYVAWDTLVRKNPEETVMKRGWVLVTLYMGPVALALYGPQLGVVTLLTVLALAGGVLLAAQRIDLGHTDGEGAPERLHHSTASPTPRRRPLDIRVGGRVRLRFIGSHNNFVHPMHVHGGRSRSSRQTATPCPSRPHPQGRAQRRARRALLRRLGGS